MTNIGRKTWAFAGGNIPLETRGPEPDYTSHERLSVLNPSSKSASLELTVFYEDKEPIGPYEIKIAAHRTKTFRFNDLIDPQAIPLETNYGIILVSNVPVVVQFGRLDSSSGEIKQQGFVPYSE